MEIELTDKVPVSEPLGRVPRQLYVQVKNYIDDVITNGWVRKSGCLGLRIFLTIYGMKYWFTTSDMSKTYHQGYTLVSLQMAKNTIWINKCPILFSKVHK